MNDPQVNHDVPVPDADGGRDPGAPTGRNLEPFLLFELLDNPSYGYNLIQRLKEYGFGPRMSQPSVVYRVLRSLEATGAIRSTWTARESGPSRRYYELTDEGRALLDRRINQLQRSVSRGQQLLAAAEARGIAPEVLA
jgi:PadR family transcriptional regulator PadR